MPTYEDPNESMESAFADVLALDRHRDRLAEVDIKVLAAYAARDKDDEPRGEALQRDGLPILGKIRIMSLEDRSDGACDVRVILHGDRWGGLSSPMQRSVIDTCLSRIEVQQADGRPQLDDVGRPKLKKAPFDYAIAGFKSVDQTWGASSVAVNSMRVLFNENGQIYLPHMALDDAPKDVLRVVDRTLRKTKIRAAPTINGNRVRGKLGTKELRERLPHIKAPSTILALAQLELQDRPRKGVEAAIKDRVMDMHLLQDYCSIERGQETVERLDLAAAVLVTTKGQPSPADLEILVAECWDPDVLDWVLEAEREGEARDEVIEVVEARIAELPA